MKNSRTIMIVIAVLVGLMLVFMASGMIDATQDKLLNKMTEGATIEMGAVPSLRMYVSSTWRGVEVVAGIVLLVTAYALYLDKKWAFPVAMTSFAALPIGSFYISLAYMVKTRAYAPAFTTFTVGLLAFWAFIFLEKKGKEAWTLFVPLTLMGMIGTQAFSFAEHGLRGLLPDKTASLINPAVAILRYSGPIMAITVFLLFVAIYQLAAGKEAGWWVALVAGLSMAVGAFPVHFARPKASMALPGTAEPSIFTSTYFLGGMLGVLLVVVLLIPFFKNQLMDTGTE